MVWIVGVDAHMYSTSFIVDAYGSKPKPHTHIQINNTHLRQLNVRLSNMRLRVEYAKVDDLDSLH